MAALVPFAWGLGLASRRRDRDLPPRHRRCSAPAPRCSASPPARSSRSPCCRPGSRPIAAWNPLAIAIDGVREALLGGAGWSEALADIAVLIPLSAVTLALGVCLFRLALDRERRLGTLGMY